MYSIFKLQLKHFLKSQTLIFLIFLFIYNVFLQQQAPFIQKFTISNVISINIIVISFFQFGGDFQSFKNTNMFKNLEASSIDHDTFRFVMIAFSTFLSLVFSLSSILVYKMISTNATASPLLLLDWDYFWWGWFIYYVILYSFLNIAIAYFVIKVLKNPLYINSVFVLLMFIVLFWGGTASSEFTLAADGTILSKNKTLYNQLHYFLPQWYMNQFIYYSYNGSEIINSVLQPQRLSGYFYANKNINVDRILFVVGPYIWLILLFSIPQYNKNLF